MNICIIGNGEDVLEHRHGDFIDNCDHVVRFNHCITEGYEQWVGSKLDIYCSPYLWCLEREVRDIEYYKQFNVFWLRQKNPLYKLYNIPTIWYTPEQEANLAKKINYNEWGVDTMYGNTEISTGLVGIEMAIEQFEGHTIYITGFDGCKTGQYRDVKKSNDPEHNRLRKINTSMDLPEWKNNVKRLRIKYHRDQNPYHLERILINKYLKDGTLNRINI